MGELEREQEEGHQEHAAVQEREGVLHQGPFRLPPLSFTDEPLSIEEGDSTEASRTLHGARNNCTRAAAVAARMAAEVGREAEPAGEDLRTRHAAGVSSMPLSSSSSSPIGQSSSSTVSTMLPSSPWVPAAARTRSSSISSDRTQKAAGLQARHQYAPASSFASSSNASSASSLNSLTPLASPTSLASMSASGSHSEAAVAAAAAAAAAVDAIQDPDQHTCSHPCPTAAPLLAASEDVLHQRRHHPVERCCTPSLSPSAASLDDEQRRRRGRSNSSSSAGSHCTYHHTYRRACSPADAGSMALPLSPLADDVVLLLLYLVIARYTRGTTTAASPQAASTSPPRRAYQAHSQHRHPHRPSGSLSLSSPYHPAAAAAVNTLGLSHDHTRDSHVDDDDAAEEPDHMQQQHAVVDVRLPYSLVSLTSSNPIRTAHAASAPADGEERRHRCDQAQAALPEQTSPSATSSSDPQGHIQPFSALSTVGAKPSQIRDTSEQVHPAPQRKNLPIIDTTVAESGQLNDCYSAPSVPSARPDLPYRIPSLNAPESFRAALPESLAKLVILDSPPAGSASLPVQAKDSLAGGIVAVSPIDELESPSSLSSAYEEGIVTPPQPRHPSHYHPPQHIALRRLSSSLPASPTQAAHAALAEALANSRHSTTLRIPTHRSSLDISASSAFPARLPLTPLEETNTPDMHLDSPADLAAEPCNPFDALTFSQNHTKGSVVPPSSNMNEEAIAGQINDANETFYHTLLEIVMSESRYTADLTDLVEVHFSLLSIARFVTEEQRAIIVRDATRLVDLHRRLQEKLQRVDEDLGWIREDDDGHASLEDTPFSPTDTDESRSTTTEERSSPSTSTPVTPVRQEYFTFNASHKQASTASKGLTRRFKSSDATVLDAARRISAIFINESQNLSQAYQPFCSGHSEAMEVVKTLSTSATKSDWDAFESQCTAHLASRRKKRSSHDSTSSSSRLHFADFLIKPVQRICRYPLLFGSLLKNAQKTSLGRSSAYSQYSVASTPMTGYTADVNLSIDRIRQALEIAKEVASGVDHAQKQRSLEVATVKLARRIEVQTTEHVKLLNKLDQVILIGSAHVIYAHAPTLALQGAPAVVKAGFYGLVLYASHLVFFKVKKTNVYEPRHWLPLRLFDLQKVQDGEGTLPYAFRMICGDHTFEIGSLCHAEQNIWLQAIEEATRACRQQCLEAAANNPAGFDELPACSLPLESTAAIFEGVSPIITSSEFGVFPAASESTLQPLSRAGSVLSSSNDEAYPSVNPGVRARLSLKPPAQRVGVDLRLADLLSESILSARAQSKRSHAMPLHGPPPRTMTASHVGQHSVNKRPHSFHTGSFSYRNIIDSTMSSRRTSLVESDSSKSSGTGMKQLFGTSASSANLAGLPQAEVSDSLRRKPTKLRRSRTSAQISDQEATDATAKPQRSSSTLGKLRRRATSLVSDSGPMKALEEMKLQEQQQRPPMPKAVVAVNTPAGPVAVNIVADQAILDASVQATVARNSSTSSSSSYASTSTDPSLGNSLETPQSSLPASPLLTPVDLETHSRWTKIGDALSHTLMRKRSFASQRPTLSIPPEALLHGAQLEQAQNAAEFIYTGRNACGSNCSHGSGSQSAATSSHSYEKRYSWDRVGWNTLTQSGQGQRSSFQGHQRSASGVSAPPSMSGGSQPNLFGGRSAPNLSSMMADKRQASSGSLWSVFERNGNGEYGSTSRGSSSPAPSIYEDAHASEDSSAYPSPAAQVASLPDIAEAIGQTVEEQQTQVQHGSDSGRVIPVTRTNPLGDSQSTTFTKSSSKATETNPVPSPTSTPANRNETSDTMHLHVPPGAGSHTPARAGSQMKRKNSLSARLRAFRTLGSGMTPVRQQQPSRSYLTK